MENKNLSLKPSLTLALSLFLALCFSDIGPVWAAPPLLTVSGNQIVTSSGCATKLKGVDVDGLEFSNSGYGPPSGGAGNTLSVAQEAVGVWKASIIRLPLNQDSWFGCGGANVTNYRGYISSIVNYCSTNNVYVILDLHWSGESSTATAPCGAGWGNSNADAQQYMADQNAVTFWSSVASVYANNPAVFFDLYNEPFSSNGNDDSTAWNVWAYGGTGNGASFSTPGMQALLNAVRGAGAQNICLIGGLGYASDLTQAQSYPFTNPGNGIVYSSHLYGNTGGGDTASGWNSQVPAALRAASPVFVGEIGPYITCNGDNGTYDTNMFSWLDNTAGVIGGTAWSLTTSSCPNLLTDWTWDRTAWGNAVFNWLATPYAVCSSGPTPTPVISSTWRVVAGGAAHTDCNSNVWAADENYTGGTAAAISTNAITGALPCSTDQALYQNQRYGTFSYSFNVPAGNYQILLKFAETYSGDFAVGDRVMNISVNGTQMITGLDVYKSVGGNTGLDETLNNIAPSGGLITISFAATSTVDVNAMVDSIQVITQPTTPTFTPTPVVASTWRVVAGGPAHTDCNSNVWAADQNFTGGTAAVISPNAITGVLPCSTDQALYQNQRYGTFSYSFNVPAGNYQVLLKFAETYSGDFAVGDRVMNISINGTQVITGLDVFKSVGGNTGLDETLNNIAPSGGVITISFAATSTVDVNAMVDSIQIIPQPATPTNTMTVTATRTSTPSATSTLALINTMTATATNSVTSTLTTAYTSTPTFTPTVAATTGCSKRMLAYYGFYDQYNSIPYTSANIPYNKFTHIIEDNLTLDCTKADGSLDLVTGAGYVDTNLISSAHAAGVKVLMEVANDFARTCTDTTFATVAASATYRTNFANNVYNFCVANGYDGVDIDWEQPETAAEGTNCTLLMQALRAKMPSPWLISMAIPALPAGWTTYNVSALIGSLDWINVMTYDFNEGTSNYTAHVSPELQSPADTQNLGALSTSIDWYIAQGVPASKLNAGMAFYGYQYPTADALWESCGTCNPAADQLFYGPDIKPLINAGGWTDHTDTSAGAHYLLANSGNGFITYDSADSISTKVNYSLSTRGVGGVFMWELSQDYDGTSQDLVSAMYNAYSAQCGVSTSTPTKTATAIVATATQTRTATRTVTSTSTVVLTSTSTMTSSATNTATVVTTSTSTPTITNTSVNTATATNTSTGSVVPLNTATVTSTLTATVANTKTSTVTMTQTVIVSMTATLSFTATPINTAANTATRTSTSVNTATSTMTKTVTSTNTALPSSTPTMTSTSMNTATRTSTAVNTSTLTMTSTSTATRASTSTSTSTSTLTPLNTSTRTMTSTSTASWTPTFTFTRTPTPVKTPTPTYTFTLTPSKTPTPLPTATVSGCAGIPTWNGNLVAYTAGQKVSYNGEEYQCIQSHTSEPNWMPNVVPALWKDLGACGSVPTSSTTTQPVVYPNPATGDSTTVGLPTMTASNVSVRIYTVAMRLVQTINAGRVSDGSVVVRLVDKSGVKLADGLYYFVVQANGQKWIMKVLVLR